MILRELLVKLGLDMDEASFASGQLAADGIKKALTLAVDAVKALGHAFVESISKTVETAGALDDMSKRTGISTDTLQSLGYAAAQSGVGTEELAVGLQILSRQAFAASKGSEESTAAFASLGVSIRDNNGQLKTSEQLMSDAADRFAAMPDGVQKTALAMQLFGRSGTRLLPVFSEGSAGIRQLQEDFEALGLGMDKASVAAGDKLGDTFTTLSKLLDAVRAKFAGPIIVALNKIIGGPGKGGFLGWYAANRKIIESKLLEWGQKVADAIEKLSRVVALIIGNLKFFAIVLGAIAAAAAVMGASLIASGIAAAVSWLAAAAPLLILAAIIAAVALAIDDVNSFLKGQDSLIGDIGPKWTKWLDDITKEREGDPWWLRALKVALRVVTDLDLAWQALTGKLSDERIFGELLGLKKSGPPQSNGPASAGWVGGLMDFIGAKPSFGGGAASPIAAAQSSDAALGDKVSKILAPQFNATFDIRAAPGQSPADVAGATREELEAFWTLKMREGAAGASGG